MLLYPLQQLKWVPQYIPMGHDRRPWGCLGIPHMCAPHMWATQLQSIVAQGFITLHIHMQGIADLTRRTLHVLYGCGHFRVLLYGVMASAHNLSNLAHSPEVTWDNAPPTNAGHMSPHCQSVPVAFFLSKLDHAPHLVSHGDCQPRTLSQVGLPLP